MTQQTASTQERATAHLPPETLANVLACVRQDTTLTESKRRETASHLRRVERALGVPLTQIPASAPEVRKRLAGLHAGHIEKAGGLDAISEKSRQNTMSAIKWALRQYGSAPATKANRMPLSDAWQRLHDQLPEARLRYALSRFMGYCTASGIEPDDVDDALLDSFHAWLRDSEIGKSPERIHRRTILAWNTAVATVPGWPQRRLTRPAARQPYTFAWNDLPEALRADAEAWLAELAGDDLFDAGPIRPVRATTIEHRRFQVRQLAGALHQQGYDIGAFTGLADLVEPETAKAALRFFHERDLARGGDPKAGSSMLASLAGMLVAIGQHWVGLDSPRRRELQRLQARVTPRQQGLRPKNRERLEPFLVERNQVLLVDLPLRTLRRASRSRTPSRREALTIQKALAVELLLMTAMRLRNLATLDVERHLRRHRGPEGPRWLISVPADEVKNAQPLDFELPRESAKLLERYLHRDWPVLAHPGNTALFPGQEPGTHKAPAHLARQISTFVKKETGLAVNPHLFRHIAAMIYLLDHPGGYEVVRRLLAHSSSETTMANYAGLETRAAVQHFNASILSRRAEAA